METITYLHGLNSTSKTFNYILDKLPEHNPILINYNSSERLNQSVQYVYSKMDDNNPTWIIGHSLGGIVGYLLALKSKIQIKGLISISAPYGGSSMASTMKWFLPNIPILYDIDCNSNAIEEINESRLHTNFISLISIAGHSKLIPGKNDGVITIESQEQTSAKRVYKLNSNHFEILQDNKAVEIIQKHIF